MLPFEKVHRQRCNLIEQRKIFKKTKNQPLEKGSITMLYHSQTNEQGELNLNKFVSVGIIANLTCNLRKKIKLFC